MPAAAGAHAVIGIAGKEIDMAETASLDLKDFFSAAEARTDRSVPWVGFPVGYAVSGVLLTVFGYFAMVLSQ
jgi:hypothetical protein